MTQTILPVACPRCGESQNKLPGGFDPDRTPFADVSCMVCGHVFDEREYRLGLTQALDAIAGRRPENPVS